ncbi:hypothetical protein ARSEF1564_010011 [Beauveria bassiana]
MKFAAILFLAAALGSASPVRTHKSIQSRDGQNDCDCSRSLYTDVSYWDTVCPDGYEDVSRSSLSLACRQVSCSEQDYKEAQCGAKPEEPPKEEPPKEEPLKEEKEEKEETPKEKTPKDETPTIMVEEPLKNNTCVEQPTKKPASPSVKNDCDCSTSLYTGVSYWDTVCPDGYEDVSRSSLSLACRQVSCSEQDYKEAQCGAKSPEDANPAIDPRS